MVQDLVEYFTKLLFISLNVDTKDEIPLKKLKDAIVYVYLFFFNFIYFFKQGNAESDLMCFFCGIDK